MKKLILTCIVYLSGCVVSYYVHVKWWKEMYTTWPHTLTSKEREVCLIGSTMSWAGAFICGCAILSIRAKHEFNHEL